MTNRTYRRFGRKKAGTWGQPHRDQKAVAARGMRRVIRRMLDNIRAAND